ncbi:MAG: DUF4382 domain-containing protein [Candidatus Aenigmarchaeota archaeon]|nr:DUF4382 domain-containing protein [Candidatus Aenigmarchaeota archaeon]
MKKILILIFLILAVSLCAIPITGQGTLQLKITDKVENVTSLIINISEIKVHKTGITEIIEEPVNETEGNETNETNETNGNETQGNETNETNNAAWITVFSGPKSIDLIAVKNVEELLGEATIDAGKYTQIRLVVVSATVDINGTFYDVTVPSKAIKFIHPFNIEANKTTSLIFDFDADKSIKEAGDKYILRPVVKVITEFEGE